MNNLICVFFGHKADRLNKILGFIQDGLSISNTGIEIGRFWFCKRCKQIFIETRNRGNEI